MQTIIRVDDLKVWLLSKNLKPEFFFPETQNILCHPIKSFAKENNIPDYLNEDHPRYSAKLAAAVEVWLAMENQKLLVGKSAKTAITEWLEQNYSEQLSKQATEECAKVANWDTKGGVPKTPVR
jgi:hypothetical protein